MLVKGSMIICLTVLMFSAMPANSGRGLRFDPEQRAIGSSKVKSYGYGQCMNKWTLPVGAARQGGYAFEYQSSRGNDCRVYEVRNLPGELLTPVRWRTKHEVLLQCKIAACKKGVECPWIVSTKISVWPKITETTLLGYGANEDEYQDEPSAFVDQSQQASTRQDLPLLITAIRGSVGCNTCREEGDVVTDGVAELDVQVKSQVKDLFLTYEVAATIIIGGKKVPTEMIAFGELPRSGYIGLYWEPTTSKRFLTDLFRPEARALTAGFTSVTTTAKGAELEESMILSVVFKGERLAATSAPAYKPKR